MIKQFISSILIAFILLAPLPLAAQQTNPGAFTFNHNHHMFIAADQTFSADTNLHNLNGLSVAMPNISSPSFLAVMCHLAISQATAGAANIYGIQFVTNGPTNSLWSALAQTSVAATGVFAATAPATITGTSATTISTATPGATATVYFVDIRGFIEWPANTAGTLNIMAGTGSASDTLTVKRDSFCFFPGF